MIPWILVATFAVGMGVDHLNAQFVAKYEFAEDLLTLAQQRGRAGRDGESAILFSHCGWVGFLHDHGEAVL